MREAYAYGKKIREAYAYATAYGKFLEEYAYAHAKHLKILKCLSNRLCTSNNVCQPIISTHYDINNVNFI